MPRRLRPVFASWVCGFFLAFTTGHAPSQTVSHPLDTDSLSDDMAVLARLEGLTERITADRSNPMLLVERASVHLSLGHPDRMLDDVARAVRITPRSASIWTAAGQVVAAHDPAAALPYFDKAISLAPRSMEPRRFRALAYAALDRLESAVADIDSALAISPNDAGALAIKGRLLMHTGKPAEAITAFSAAIRGEPSAVAFYDRGFCHYLLGDYPRAINDYSAALRLDGSLLAAAMERGLAYQRTGLFREAVQDLEHARTQRPDDNELALLLSWIYATSPDADVRDGHKALVLASSVCDPMTCNTPEPLHALAAAYAELGDFATATTLQKRAVSLSHFAPEFHALSLQRLDILSSGQPLRDARTPLFVMTRDPAALPRDITAEEANTLPADVLGRSYLQVQVLLLGCRLARAGATFTADLDGSLVSLTPTNVGRFEERLVDRSQVYATSIRSRGYTELANGYRARALRSCDEWGIGEAPWLVEQTGFDLEFAQGGVIHRGVVIESTVLFQHDMDMDIILVGTVDDHELVFAIPQRHGVTGDAQEGCRFILTPATIAGDEWADALMKRAFAHRESGEYAAAVADIDRAVAMAPSADGFAVQAYALATCPDATVRDGRRAVHAAAQALALSADNPDAFVLGAAAAAAAEAGDFQQAVAYQRRAIRLTPEEDRPFMEERLHAFESRRTHRDE